MNKELKEQGKIQFRKLWSNINKDNQHLTTEMIEDLIDSLIDKTVQHERERIVGIIREHFNQADFVEYGNYRKSIEEDELITLITNKSDINS